VAKVALWVACRNCGLLFDSGLRLEAQAFRRGTLAANYHTCPNCGVRETYRKADYTLREAPPSPRGERSWPRGGPACR
jgi:rubredoxin